MNRQIDIKEATETQLRDFGRDTLGLNLPPNAKIETLRAKITAAWNKDYILVPGEETESKQEGDAPHPVTDDQMPPKKGLVKIHIQLTEDPGGDEPVPVGVNGKVMLIPRGKDVEVPHAYFEVLSNAIAHKYDPMPGGGINPVPRAVPLYPFQRVA